MSKKEKGENSAPTRTSKRFAPRFWAWWRRSYVREVSVVIIGILITFQGTGWINKASQRKEVREILAMIKVELTENANELKGSLSDLNRELEGMNFFARYMDNIGDAPLDSIAMFRGVLGTGLEYFYSDNALAVLKASPSAANSMDKELMKMIFSCYDDTGAALRSVNIYYSTKFDIVGKFYYSSDRKAIQRMQRDNDFLPYIRAYLGNVSTANLVLNTRETLTGKPELIARIIEDYNKTIERIDTYTGKK